MSDRELVLHQQEVMRDREEEAEVHSCFKRFVPKLIQWDEEEAPRNYNRYFANGDDNGEK